MKHDGAPPDEGDTRLPRLCDAAVPDRERIRDRATASRACEKAPNAARNLTRATGHSIYFKAPGPAVRPFGAPRFRTPSCRVPGSGAGAADARGRFFV